MGIWSEILGVGALILLIGGGMFGFLYMITANEENKQDRKLSCVQETYSVCMSNPDVTPEHCSVMTDRMCEP